MGIHSFLQWIWRDRCLGVGPGFLGNDVNLVMYLLRRINYLYIGHTSSYLGVEYFLLRTYSFVKLMNCYVGFTYSYAKKLNYT